tara:strand:+ start:2338 stop:3672 length:1335 start_codon:yes stop_codon:yes gene_type:complete
MTRKKVLKIKDLNKSFSKNRRFKSSLFLIANILVGLAPHIFNKKSYLPLILVISSVVFIYGLFVISNNRHNKIQQIKSGSFQREEDWPTLDILVAARDEQNVIQRLIEMLFNLDYPSEKLNIYIIDDGSTDDTSLILNNISKKYPKLNIITRTSDAGGGKSGALNYALQFTSGEWVFILDADAQLRNDTLKRLFHFAFDGSWSAVQLRKSVLNTDNTFLTNGQSMEMVMDAVFQYGRLCSAGVSELRGNGQLIKKDVLISCGAFNEETVTDDLDLSIRLLLAKSKIGILWDPPVMEEAVESFSALFAQRQRWAEGGLQRFFDYLKELIFGKLDFSQKFDLTYFVILQYSLPIISVVDILSSIYFDQNIVYWPISLTAFCVSGIACFYGCYRKNEGPTIPRPTFRRMVSFLAYLSHWFVIIPYVTFKMSIFPKKILWKKTLHKGI